MNKFKAKAGTGISEENANKYGNEVLKLMKRLKKDTVTANEIVEDAKNESRSYHGYFDWDNEKAGNKWRTHQARKLLIALVEVDIIKQHGKKKEVFVRSFYNVRVENSRGYARKEYAFSHEDTAKQIIEKALSELLSWQKRYRIYQELSGLTSQIEDLVKRFSTQKKEELVSTT